MAHVKERGVFFTKGRQLSAHELRVTAEEILHGRLLRFEAEAGLALADGTDAEVGDKLGHWYKNTPIWGFVTKVKRTFKDCEIDFAGGTFA
jgi:hypothetical protein